MRKLLFAFLALFIFASCSEDDPGSDNDYNKLTKEDWKFTEWTIKYTSGAIEYTIDIFEDPTFAFVDSCILDDELSFDSDKTYQTKPGFVICDPAASFYGNGNWQIIDDSISIEPYGAPYSLRYYLVELSDSILRFEHIIELNNSNGGTIEGLETFTYKN